jgi:hypothetical protein
MKLRYTVENTDLQELYALLREYVRYLIADLLV